MPKVGVASTILVVEDDQDVIDTLETALSEAGYKFVSARTARDAFSCLFRMTVDLVILDINLPDLDGFSVVREIKRNFMLQHIPVILLSGSGDFLDRMAQLDVTVDEYLAKPFNIQDLLLRVKMVPARAQSSLNANPLTHLPGNTDITRVLTDRLAKNKPYAVAYADINNFKAFNDKYGFQQGDEVIKFTAKTIVEAVQTLSPADAFVGHVGGDDFIFVCAAERAESVAATITRTFDEKARDFYSQEDREKGFIVVKDRRGVISHFPIVSIAVGLVVDDEDKYNNLGQINNALTELKKYAKSFEGSAYVRDRRTPRSEDFQPGVGDYVVSAPSALGKLADALSEDLDQQFRKILDEGALTVLFQPIVQTDNKEVIGHEGLVRGPSGPFEFPNALFKAARANGTVAALDLMCMRKVFMAAAGLHKGIKRFVNVFPETVMNEERLIQVLSLFSDQLPDLVIELSGSQRERDANELFKALKRLKAESVKLCLDADPSSLERSMRIVKDLRPHYVKVNMTNYVDLEHNPGRREDFFKTIALIRNAGSQAICAKLEFRSDFLYLARAGVTLAQGFMFAPPSTL